MALFQQKETRRPAKIPNEEESHEQNGILQALNIAYFTASIYLYYLTRRKELSKLWKSIPCV